MSATPADLPPALTVEQAAALLGVGLTTARAQIRNGTWPSPVIRIGRQYRIPRDPLLELLGILPLPGHDEGRPASRPLALAEAPTTLVNAGAS